MESKEMESKESSKESTTKPLKKSVDLLTIRTNQANKGPDLFFPLFNTLPTELQWEVFSFLDPLSLVAFSSINKTALGLLEGYCLPPNHPPRLDAQPSHSCPPGATESIKRWEVTTDVLRHTAFNNRNPGFRPGNLPSLAYVSFLEYRIWKQMGIANDSYQLMMALPQGNYTRWSARGYVVLALTFYVFPWLFEISPGKQRRCVSCGQPVKQDPARLKKFYRHNMWDPIEIIESIFVCGNWAGPTGCMAKALDIPHVHDKSLNRTLHRRCAGGECPNYGFQMVRFYWHMQHESEQMMRDLEEKEE